MTLLLPTCVYCSLMKAYFGVTAWECFCFGFFCATGFKSKIVSATRAITSRRAWCRYHYSSTCTCSWETNCQRKIWFYISKLRYYDIYASVRLSVSICYERLAEMAWIQNTCGCVSGNRLHVHWSHGTHDFWRPVMMSRTMSCIYKSNCL